MEQINGLMQLLDTMEDSVKELQKQPIWDRTDCATETAAPADGYVR